MEISDYILQLLFCIFLFIVYETIFYLFVGRSMNMIEAIFMMELIFIEVSLITRDEKDD